MKPPFLRPIRFLTLIVFTASLSVSPVGSKEREPPLAGKDDTYVALSTYGCLGRCPSFDLYVFPNGHLIFRGHQFTARKGVVHRTISRQAYEHIRSFLEKHEVFKEREECKKEWMTDHPGLDVYAASAGIHQESYWYWGSECDVPLVDQIYELFVMETNAAALVTKDTRRWQERQREMDKENAAAK